MESYQYGTCSPACSHVQKHSLTLFLCKRQQPTIIITVNERQTSIADSTRLRQKDEDIRTDN
jgi:hypothetical protein